MPVITLYYDRLRAFMKKPITKEMIIDRLPYIGLDIEGEEEDHVKVEYNPNRPDFSTDYGVARALKGILGYEIGSPDFNVREGNVTVHVDKSVLGVRPYFVGMIVRNLVLDDETVRQMISMQEDLHKGVGRNRKKVSIGIHNYDVLKPPIKYSTALPTFSFVPLGRNAPMIIKEILSDTDVGRDYGWIVSGHRRYPILLDSKNDVLSFPPIINGDLTKVSKQTKNLFIDVTATDLHVAENCLAILTAFLSDAGGEPESISVLYHDHTITSPVMLPNRKEVDVDLARRLLGLNLTEKQVMESLGRSRITTKKIDDRVFAYIPRYRVDILHAVDLVEEIAIGYGIDTFSASPPSLGLPGSLTSDQSFMNSVREVMLGLGMVEVVNSSLASTGLLYDLPAKTQGEIVRVSDTKSKEYEILRDSLTPYLLQVLSRNIHQEYPQRIFEIGKVFLRDNSLSSGVREDYHLAAVVASSYANYTEAKSYLTTFLDQLLNLTCETIPANQPPFQDGRVASIRISSEIIGLIGEISAVVLDNFALRTPVAGFEVNLSRIIRLIHRKKSHNLSSST